MDATKKTHLVNGQNPGGLKRPDCCHACLTLEERHLSEKFARPAYCQLHFTIIDLL